MPEENAEERIIFIAASDEGFLSRSKLAIAAIGMVDNSSDRKNINRLPLEIIRNIPNNADNIRIRNSGMCSLFFSQDPKSKLIRYAPNPRIVFSNAMVGEV